MQAQEGVLRLKTPSGHQIRLEGGVILHAELERRGVPIEMGFGAQFIYPHRKLGLGDWIPLANVESRERIRAQVKDANPPHIHAWCTVAECEQLRKDIRKRGPWQFGDDATSLADFTTTHIWIALIRHMLIRRELQDPQAIAIITDKVKAAVGNKIIRAHDPVLRSTPMSREVTPPAFIRWVLELSKPKQPVVTAWQQAAQLA